MYRRHNINDAQEILKMYGYNWYTAPFDIKELVQGLDVELEHSDITRGDMYLTGRIAMAHLLEDPEYYTKLKVMEGGATRTKKLDPYTISYMKRNNLIPVTRNMLKPRVYVVPVKQPPIEIKMPEPQIIKLDQNSIYPGAIPERTFINSGYSYPQPTGDIPPPPPMVILTEEEKAKQKEEQRKQREEMEKRAKHMQELQEAILKPKLKPTKMKIMENTQGKVLGNGGSFYSQYIQDLAKKYNKSYRKAQKAYKDKYKRYKRQVIKQCLENKTKPKFRFT